MESGHERCPIVTSGGAILVPDQLDGIVAPVNVTQSQEASDTFRALLVAGEWRLRAGAMVEPVPGVVAGARVQSESRLRAGDGDDQAWVDIIIAGVAGQQTSDPRHGRILTSEVLVDLCRARARGGVLQPCRHGK